MIKYNAFVLAAFFVTAPALAWSTSARAESCTNDIDCKSLGTGCGTQVCSYTANMTCANAGQSPGMEGWCTVNTDCKCNAQGATCVGEYCSFTTPQSGSSNAGSGSSSSGSPSSGSSSSGSPSSGSSTSESGSSSSGTE